MLLSELADLQRFILRLTRVLAELASIGRMLAVGSVTWIMRLNLVPDGWALTLISIQPMKVMTQS
jgi:hypothetical protein